LIAVNINNDGAVYPDEREIGVVSGIVSLFPRHTNTETLETGLIGEVSGEATPEGNSVVTTLYFARLTILIEVGPNTLSSEIVMLLGNTSSDFDIVVVNKVGEMGAGLV